MKYSYEEKNAKRKERQMKLAEAAKLIEEAERLSDEIEESFSFLDRTYTPKTGGGWDAGVWISSYDTSC